MNAMNVSRVVALLMLAGIGVQRYVTTHQSVHVEAYQQRIRAAADAIPNHIGPWVGQDVRVPAQALSLLKPNVMISRRYLDVENGATAGLMLVHCSDAHDMAGHFPLRCYPAQGWVLRSSVARDWDVDGLKLTGTEYEFVRDDESGKGQRHIFVANCLFRPGGQVLRDMHALARSIVGAGGEATGAGQMQVYFDADVPREQRDSAIRTLVGGYRPVLNAILANPDH